MGLKGKILLIAITVSVVGVGIALSVGGHFYGKAYNEALQSRSVAIAQGLKIQMDRILQLGIDMESLVGFEKQCRDVVDTYEGIDFAMVVGRDQTILFHSDATRNGTRLMDSSLAEAVRSKAAATAKYEIGGTSGSAAVIPIVAADGAYLGSVAVGLSEATIIGRLQAMTLTRVGLALVLLLLGVSVMVAALRRYVTTPIERLVSSMDRVRADPVDLTQRVAVESRDEIGALAQTFNGLMQSLQETTVSKATLADAYAALQASEARYRELVSNANVIILRLALDGTVTFFNEFAELFFGFASGDIVGRHVVGTIVPPRETDTGRDLGGMIAAIIEYPDRYAVNENENMTRDGRRVFVRWANRVIRDAQGKPVGLLAIGQDITEKKRTDAELDKHRHHLETLVQDRTVALSVAKEAAEAANRAKTTFLANMSHELRTPLNGIMGMADLAKRRATDPRQIDQLQHVARSSKHLLGIINDILDVSRIESNKLSLEEKDFRLAEVTDNVLSLFEPRATEKGLGFFVDLPGDLADRRLLGDPVRLGQVLINLAGNAVKFTEAGSVTVRAGVERETSTDLVLRFEVADSGIGISDTDRQRLFSAFEQADGSLTRRYGGTGLGLAISKGLVQMMGGSIGVDSQPGRGSTFWFTARVGKAAESAPKVEPAPASDAERQLGARFRGTRVLLAEDEPVNQEVARELLEDAGLRIDVADDGAAAVEMAGRTEYALILMDMQMPHLNGLDATRAIRAMAGRERTPIIAMTANAFAEDRQRCLAAGMNDFIVKPVQPERLFETVAWWLDPAQQAGHD